MADTIDDKSNVPALKQGTDAGATAAVPTEATLLKAFRIAVVYATLDDIHHVT